jgi:hypothetical protein
MNDVTSRRNVLLSFADSWWLVLVVAILTGGICFQRWYYTHRSRPATLKAGDQLPALSLARLDGKVEQISWQVSGPATLVYVFRPDCIWCRRNFRAMTALSEHAAGYRVIGVSTTSKDLQAYVRKPYRLPGLFSG